MKRRSIRIATALTGAAATAVVLAGTSAATHLGSLQLGHANTSTAQTTLSANLATPVLKVVNQGSAAAVRGEGQNGIGTNGISTSGVGQQGLSQTGIGTLGTHGATTGINPGVQGETNSTDPNGAGVVGKNMGGGPGLRAIVNAGAPPLAVNSGVKVANLNADKLDDLDSAALQKRVTGTCAAGSAVKTVNADGTVACEPVGGGGVWSLNGNSGTTPGTNFLGTTDNKALELKVNGQRALRIEPDATSPNLIGGSSANSVDVGHVGSVIAGGGSAGTGNANHVLNDYDFVGAGLGNEAGSASGGGASAVIAGTGNVASGGSALVGAGGVNHATGDYAFVGAGQFNTASGSWSLVAGGWGSTASGVQSSIGGGYSNTASGDHSLVAGGTFNAAAGLDSAVGGGYSNTAGFRSAVAGGTLNTASGTESSVGGGFNNAASGPYSGVPGGISNTASGIVSFAAGTRAKATLDGSFVWGDNTDADLTSPAVNSFTVRASGGIWLGTTSTPSIGLGRFIDTSTGAYLSSTGTWASNSDRSRKHAFRPLSKPSVLEKVARLPITSWSYKAEKPSVRHIGPMAQDFYKAFGLGLDNEHITTIDEGGVALAAIQGLARQNQALSAGLTRSERVNAALSARLARVEHELQLGHQASEEGAER